MTMRELMKEISKVCINCEFERPLTEYYLNSNMPDGRVNVCKVCKREYDRGRTNRRSQISRLLQEWKPAA